MSIKFLLKQYSSTSAVSGLAYTYINHVFMGRDVSYDFLVVLEIEKWLKLELWIKIFGKKTDLLP